MVWTAYYLVLGIVILNQAEYATKISQLTVFWINRKDLKEVIKLMNGNVFGEEVIGKSNRSTGEDLIT